MKKTKLDKLEQGVEDTILEYKTVSAGKKKRIQNIIKKANEKKNISLRVNSQDLDLLKIRAEQEGIPYQTLLSSIIHKFVSDQLVDQKNILKSIKLLKTAM
jgi:predicted DNA binding CopG/RHH family protein